MLRTFLPMATALLLASFSPALAHDPAYLMATSPPAEPYQQVRNQTGTITGWAAVMRDVTKRFNEMKDLLQKLAQAGRSCRGQTTG